MLTVFGLMLAPFPRGTWLQIAARVFPVGRGLYEGKVGNLWCMLDVRPFDIQRKVPPAAIRAMCALATAVASAPFCVMAWRSSRGGAPDGLYMALAGSAMSAFLFSYHVHEKSVLMPLVMYASSPLVDPGRVARFAVLAAGGCRFLWGLDGLVWEARGLAVLCVASLACKEGAGAFFAPAGPRRVDYAYDLSILACLALQLGVEAAMVLMGPTPVPGLPDLWELIIAVISFGGYGVTWLHMVVAGREAGKFKDD